MVTPTDERRTLNVFLHDRLAGTLRYDGSVFQFAYTQAYLKNLDAIPLSLSLPLTAEEHKGAFSGKQLPHYFYHLLPEGWLLDLAKSLKMPVDHPMDLLSQLVVKTIGAVLIAKAEGIVHSVPISMATKPLLLEPDPVGPAAFVKRHNQCLYCANPLVSGGLNDNYHPQCSLQLFGSLKAPRLTIDRERIREVAAEQLTHGESLTGVQEKFSLKHRRDRQTIVAPLSAFVAKPQPWSPDLPELANLEGAYMLFARSLGLPVAASGLIYLADGTACFISRRFDINADGTRIHQEDMAAPLAKYRKYESSHEGIADILMGNPTLSEEEGRRDRVNFLRITIFNFLMGNTDAHLKNFALFHELRDAKPSYRLTPFYDIFPSLLYAARDTDELGLNLGSRKNRLTKREFDGLAKLLELGPRTVSAFIGNFRKSRESLIQALAAYEVSKERQYAVLELARKRLLQLGHG